MSPAPGGAPLRSVPTIMHEPRTVLRKYPELPRRILESDDGPMGLRCLHPLPPGMAISHIGYDVALAEIEKRCAFEDCVCACHVPGERR